MITALLLAAGEGRRMNHQAKALLAFADQTFIERSLQQLESAVDEIIVVTGAYRVRISGERNTAGEYYLSASLGPALATLTAASPGVKRRAPPRGIARGN